MGMAGEKISGRDNGNIAADNGTSPFALTLTPSVSLAVQTRSARRIPADPSPMKCR